MGVRTVPVMWACADRARGARFLTDTSVCVPCDGADLLVVSRCTSGAGASPKRHTAWRATSLDGNAVRPGGNVADDDPGDLLVRVPACPAPCALKVAGFHPCTHRARASDPLHRLCSHGRAVRHRPHHQVAILTFLAGGHQTQTVSDVLDMDPRPSKLGAGLKNIVHRRWL